MEYKKYFVFYFRLYNKLYKLVGYNKTFLKSLLYIIYYYTYIIFFYKKIIIIIIYNNTN